MAQIHAIIPERVQLGEGYARFELIKKLPAVEILRTENIFVMDDQRAAHQDIRPLKIFNFKSHATENGHRNPVVTPFGQYTSTTGY